jgi:hypothetical protein
MGMMKSYYVYRSKSGWRMYFRARWVKRRKTYRLWSVYPRCDDVPFVPGWNRCPVELVEQSKKLKGRPSNKTLTEAWLMKSELPSLPCPRDLGGRG